MNFHAKIVGWPQKTCNFMPQARVNRRKHSMSCQNDGRTTEKRVKTAEALNAMPK